MTRNDEMACFVSVDSREEKLTALSKEIWEYAEPGLKEKKSSAAIESSLKKRGSAFSSVLAPCRRPYAQNMARDIR